MLKGYADNYLSRTVIGKGINDSYSSMIACEIRAVEGEVHFLKWIENRIDNIPMWITHPVLYHEMSCFYYALYGDFRQAVSVKYGFDALGIRVIDEMVTSSVTNVMKIKKGALFIGGLRGAEQSFSDVIVDEDKFFIWRMAN